MKCLSCDYKKFVLSYILASSLAVSGLLLLLIGSPQTATPAERPVSFASSQTLDVFGSLGVPKAPAQKEGQEKAFCDYDLFGDVQLAILPKEDMPGKSFDPKKVKVLEVPDKLKVVENKLSKDIETKPYNVRIVSGIVSGGLEVSGWGSGTYFYDDGYYGAVLSVAHVYEDSWQDAYVKLPDGRTTKVIRVYRNKKYDLSISIVKSMGITPPKMADQKRTGTFYVAGYGGLVEPFRVIAGRIVGRVSTESDVESVVISHPIRHGDSGGGVFNSEGELAGVAWGSDLKTQAAFVPLVTDPIQAWMKEKMDQVKTLPKAADRLIVVGSPTCLPCEMLKPLLERLKLIGYDIKYVFIDEYTGEQPVSRYPTLLFYNGPKLTDKIEGMVNEDDITSRLDKKAVR